MMLTTMHLLHRLYLFVYIYGACLQRNVSMLIISDIVASQHLRSVDMYLF